MLLDDLNKVIIPEVENLGFLFWGIEVRSNHYSNSSLTICVFIDSSQGVSLDECEIVSQALSAVLDVESIFDHLYYLEVSSPGLDRRIFNIRQVKNFINSEVVVKLHDEYSSMKQRTFKAIILNTIGNKIILSKSGKEFSLYFNKIDKISIIPKFD